MNLPDSLRLRARQELERRLGSEKGRYYTPNGGIERFLRLVADHVQPNEPHIKIFIIEAGNGVGKSCLAANLASYLTNRYPNPWFDRVPGLRDFRRPNSGRILTTATAAKENYDEEFEKWLPGGRYRAHKNGYKFNQSYEMLGTKSGFDIQTFDQAPNQGESVTKDWGIIDEPCSRRHFTALKSRLRFGGIIFIIQTPLEGSAWMDTQLLTPRRLGRDVFKIRLSSEENCREHGVRGFLPHSVLEDQWADYPEDELGARKDGIPVSAGSLIYRGYRDDPSGHVMPGLDGYYGDCWAAGAYTLWHVVDPHDRKPWMINWWASFPNGHDVCVAEWPDLTMKPFHEIKSWGWGINRYAQQAIETEAALGAGFAAHATIMDPNYGPKATVNAEGVSNIAAEFQKAYRALAAARPGMEGRRRMIFPRDSLTDGHLAVKTALGDLSRGDTPLIHWLELCSNSRFSMGYYGVKENRDEARGISETPVLQFKDPADLARYMRMAKARYIELDPDDPGMLESQPTVTACGYERA